MLEEYLDGPEVDVDLVFSEGAAGKPLHGLVIPYCATFFQTLSV